MNSNQARRNRVFTALGCVGVFMLFGASAEAYNRYRARRSAADYSAVMPSQYRHQAMSGYGLRRESPRNPRYDVGAVYSRTRGHHGTLTEEGVSTYRREFLQGQSPRAIYSALGYPSEQEGNRDVWRVQRADGSYGNFVAEYSSSNRGYTYPEW